MIKQKKRLMLINSLEPRRKPSLQRLEKETSELGGQPDEQFTELSDGSMNEQSPRKRLHITAKLSRQIYDAEKELLDILRGSSIVSPELKELEQERERRRYERQSEYVKKLMQDSALVKGLTIQKARDILWSLTGRDMYRMLVIERAWSSDEYEKWLGKVLVESLLVG